MKLKEVIDLQKTVDATSMLFGHTKEFATGFVERYKGLGQTIQRELKVSVEEAINLSHETELGPHAQNEFEKLKIWLATQHPIFQKKDEKADERPADAFMKMMKEDVE